MRSGENTFRNIFKCCGFGVEFENPNTAYYLDISVSILFKWILLSENSESWKKVYWKKILLKMVPRKKSEEKVPG